MSELTQGLNQRILLLPRADFVSDGQKEIIQTIMKLHGQENCSNINLIDENDDYDSFLVEASDLSFCIKLSFDNVPIFYDFLILKGIEELNIAPTAIDRKQINLDKVVYYTIQTFEHSENLFTLGNSHILEKEYNLFDFKLKKLHTFKPPKEVYNYLDNTQSYLEYHKINFNNILCYIEENENEEFLFVKDFYEKVYEDMFSFFLKNKQKIQSENLVHGNLNSSTIISNSYDFKFINFENAFVGSPFFDLANLVFELQMSGLKEFDFISKKIALYQMTDNRLKAAKEIEEYKICKYIWTRKKLLDLICQYIKEVLILNKSRKNKMEKLAFDFSNNHYRFSDIQEFANKKSIIIDKFTELALT